MEEPIMASQLHYLTYERTNLQDIPIDYNTLERCCPLDFGRHDDGNAAIPPSPEFSLGLLDRLPRELLHIVFLDLALQSLHVLRTVNRGVRHVIDALPQYRTVVTHAPHAIRAVLSGGLASSISCRNLHDALRVARARAVVTSVPFSTYYRAVAPVFSA